MDMIDAGADALLSAFRSRTVPTKLHTAPTRLSARRNAATSSARLKSSVWIETRALMSSPAGHRRKEGDLAAIAQGGGFLAHHLVQRDANRLAARQALRIRATARDQLVAQCRHVCGRGFERFAAVSHGLPDRGEILHGHLHPISSANEMKRTGSPRSMLWPAGLSTSPSPHTADVSTPELWLANRSRPPCSLRRTRRNSRRLSPRGKLKCAGSSTLAGASRVAPCSFRRNGRTSSRKVMKLETGLPGSPMKCAGPTLP